MTWNAWNYTCLIQSLQHVWSGWCRSYPLARGETYECDSNQTVAGLSEARTWILNSKSRFALLPVCKSNLVMSDTCAFVSLANIFLSKCKQPEAIRQWQMIIYGRWSKQVKFDTQDWGQRKFCPLHVLYIRGQHLVGKLQPGIPLIFMWFECAV